MNYSHNGWTNIWGQVTMEYRNEGLLDEWNETTFSNPWKCAPSVEPMPYVGCEKNGECKIGHINCNIRNSVFAWTMILLYHVYIGDE